MIMSPKLTAWHRHSEALADPNIIVRAQFFGIRHPLAISVAIALFVSIGGVAAFAWFNDIAIAGTAGLMLAYTAACFVNAVMSIVWLVATRRRDATPSHFAGAFAAATSDEKPHLMRRLEARAANRIIAEPITTLELVAIFEGVRAEHGARAVRQRRAKAAAITRQEDCIGRMSKPAWAPGNSIE
jgi:hypothetical protein